MIRTLSTAPFLILYSPWSRTQFSHTWIHWYTHIYTEAHKSNYIIHYKDIDNLLKMNEQDLLLILLRNSLKALKTSQCIQPSFPQALVFFLSSLQNPSWGTSKMVIMFQLFYSIGSLFSLLYSFSLRPFLYSISHAVKFSLLDFPIWISHPFIAL